MKYLGYVVHAVRISVARDRSLWLVIILVAIIFGVSLWISQYLFPQYSELWILFLYTLPSEFLIAVLPHEPIILYFSKSYNQFTVTWVTLAGTIFIEYINYMLVTLFFKSTRLIDLKRRQTFQNAIHYFLLIPFFSLVIAAITPIPFYPFRIIAPMSGYPVKKYLMAILIGRTPRFYFLAYFGHIVVLSNKVIILLFILLSTLLVISLIRRKVKDKKVLGFSQ
ncbi:MAG: VTT domain-containing protein [Candidatus Hodarchaeota archaeon]